MNSAVQHFETLPAIQQSASGSTEMQALISVMQQAISNPDIPVERMEKLLNMAMDASERLDANRAKKAYAAAMAEFKRNPPKIVKDAHVHYKKKDGSVTDYDHASLGALCNAVIAGLAQVGISHDWQLSHDNKLIKVTCVLTHALGHKESFPSIPALPDDSGGKNAIQANQSTVTYLQRSTLFSATGLAALAPQDNDGRGAPGAETTGAGDPPTDGDETCGGKYITAKQAADMMALLTEIAADVPAFLKWNKAESIGRIKAANYKTAMAAIEERRRNM
jgi:hypothetical protein